MEDVCLLIDGSSLLSTSFYATVPKSWTMAKTEKEKTLIAKQKIMQHRGLYTNGVVVFLKTFKKLVKYYKPTYLCVTWDISRDTFRRDIYPLYKAQRKETPSELKEQFETTQQILKKMKVKQVKFDKYEADDIIKTLANKFKKISKVTIWSKDKDLTQLINDKDKIKMNLCVTKNIYESEINDVISAGGEKGPNGTFLFNQFAWYNYYGVNPIQIPDFKGLAGDASDNIPGVNGISEKTAKLILKKYKNIENLIDDISGISEDKLGKKEYKEAFKRKKEEWLDFGITSKTALTYMLKECAFEDALLSKKLATIVNIPNVFINYNNYKLPSFENWNEIVMSYNMKSLCKNK